MIFSSARRSSTRRSARLRALAPKITHLARLEGLDDHARSVEVRFREEFLVSGFGCQSEQS